LGIDCLGFLIRHTITSSSFSFGEPRGAGPVVAKIGPALPAQNFPEATSVLAESEQKLWIVALTRFLHAKWYPLRLKTL
jgi:hypothetical protein